MAARKTTKPKPERKLRVLQIGNFRAEHSTENHLKRALETNGIDVIWMQEDGPDVWRALSDRKAAPALAATVDFVLWTRTGWDYLHPNHGEYSSYAEVHGMQALFLNIMGHANVPVVAYHLDTWAGLKREHELDEPFFMCDLVVTADGGADDVFATRHIRHHWMPPGVSAPECEPGMFRDEFHSRLAFVGSWQGGYHDESPHRFDLVRWLGDNFRRDCKFWPEQGRPAVRGADLRDLYASVDVTVGDSCFAGSGRPRYWSDRIPESIGRGSFLLHPDVPGLAEEFPKRLPLLWEANDWDALGSNIEFALSMTLAERHEWTNEGRAWVLANHTYERRMEQLIALLVEKGLLR